MTTIDRSKALMFAGGVLPVGGVSPADLTQERNARAAGDQNLQSQISAIVDGSAITTENSFSTRDAFVAWDATATGKIAGMVIFAAGLPYVYDGVSSAIPDLPGWVPGEVARRGNFPNGESYLALPSLLRNRDSLSALDLMTSGSLDDAIRHREATASDASAITQLVTEALNACAAKRWRAIVPGGDYYLNAAVPVSGGLTLAGDGPSASRMIWSSGSGLNIQPTTPTKTDISDIAILASHQAVDGAALTIDYSAAGDTIPARQNRGVTLRNFELRGSRATNADGWSDCLRLIDAIDVDLRGARFAGYLTNAQGPYKGTAISFTGENGPTKLWASQFNITGLNRGVYTAGVEGVYLSQFEMPTINEGIIVENQDVTVWGGEPGLIVSDGHINAFTRNIDLTHVLQYRISNILQYVRAAPLADGVVVRIGDGCKWGVLNNNVYHFTANTFWKTAIQVDGGTWLTIDQEQFNCEGTNSRGIYVGSGAVNTDIGKQDWIAATSRITNLSGSTTFEERVGYAAPLNDIVMSSRRTRQVHHLVGGATNLPTGETATGSTVETFSQSSTLGHQMFFSGGTDAVYRRRFSGGVWQSWVQL
ncbi:pyocin knob domain-containing protein [Paenirhodobacter populi]|uniref:Pectate lyase superfamily protein domain-containing protein n=1 Tax=Paenirhodobacter populi TaxID=2306993 RepID=A0A443IQJ0_9RHOB|nr:pyocin knob domain-containing protein [Sinirhodobacter populi]RWR08535.1 hypothetical protein D2T33_15680 [Sinirhodobacter populi]